MDFKSRHVKEVRKVESLSSLKQFYGRIIVISNRLPVTIEENTNAKLGDNGESPSKWVFNMSAGGLVAGLEGVKKKLPFLWVGWTGKWYPDEQQDEIAEILQEKYSCIPVWLTEQLAEDYYNGFSNGVLWPLFHYLTAETGANYSEKLWSAYVECNNRFADVLLKIWKPGDLIWIHDYHLIMLPEILRDLESKIRIGFFLHIPFPSSEIFTVFPKRKAILTGMLNCDMIGFHTYDYARHFMSACTKILGLETTPAGLMYEGRFIPISVMPVGIDPEKFLSQLEQPSTLSKIAELEMQFGGKKVILGVDRLDYIKGIPHKLRGLERFFQKYPQWQDKVVLIQIAVPSRTDVIKYRCLKQEVEQLVGHINGTYGNVECVPVVYLFKSVSLAELSALYRISDVAIISSLRDGMNLVAQEYIACQKGKNGVLILSEFAGCSNSLGSGGILINPWNQENVADAIYEAITMPEYERESRQNRLFDYVFKHNACYWGESFIKELDRVNRTAEKLDKIPRITWLTIARKFRIAKKRLLIFSTDGGLIPYVEIPFLASPSRRVISVLEDLSRNPFNIVYVVSGRDRRTLMQWFGHLNVGLVAEHGFFWRYPKAKGQDIKNHDLPWESLENQCDLSFKKTIKPIFQHFTERTPGSFFEDKETSLTWHFRSTESNFGRFRAQELHTHLDTATFHANVVIGEKSLEVRPHECNPTVVLKRLMKRHEDFDFCLYIGEATTNLDELEKLPHVFTCSVAKKYQKYHLTDTEDVVGLMIAMATNGEYTHSPKVPEFMKGRRSGRVSPIVPIKNLT